MLPPTTAPPRGPPGLTELQPVEVAEEQDDGAIGKGTGEEGVVQPVEEPGPVAQLPVEARHGVVVPVR